MTKTIIINNIEYELEQHDNGKTLKEIIIPEGWRLLLPSEAMMLYERGLIDYPFWFFVEQTNKEQKIKENVAEFCGGLVRASLSCDWNSDSRINTLGVIFCRDLSKLDKGIK
jgi:hypothetical protein